MTTTTNQQQQRAASGGGREADLRYRRVDYRLTEGVRKYGASVRPADEITDCWTCKRRLKPGSRIVRLVEPIWWQCTPCAIADGVLEPIT